MKKRLKLEKTTDFVECVKSVYPIDILIYLLKIGIVLLFIVSSHMTFAQVVSMNGALSVSGNKIVNKNGVPVSFAGNSFFWSNTGWGGEKYYNANVVSWLKSDWNSAIVRVAMGVEDGGGYLDNPNGNYSNQTGNKARIKAVIDAAIANNMYVIIDWHTHHAEWNTTAAIAFFQEMAQTYGHLPNVMYEVYNEPLSVSWSGVIKPYAIQVIDAIRTIDPDNIIIVGTPSWSADVDQAANDPINRSNVAYTVHFYAGSHGQTNRDKCQYALDKGLAVVITEWGTVNADGNGAVNVTETNAWIDFMKRNKLTNCNWSINDKNEGASAVTGGASTSGGWPSNNLTWSGSVVRDFLRSYDYGSLKDEINFVNSPNLTTSKNTYSVQVNYTVTQKRDLVISFCDSVNTVLQTKTVQVETGESVDVSFPMNALPEVGKKYAWKAELRPVGGNASTNLASQKNATVLMLPQAPIIVLEAESYDAMSGVQKEACKESGDNVSYIDANDWLSYASITIPTAGKYRVFFRVASMNNTGVISLEKDAGATKLATFSVPNTGGWQTWTTISKVVDLPQGTYSIGLGIPTGGFNINWIAVANEICTATATITSLANSFCQGGNLLLTASAGASYKWMNGTAQVGTAQTYTAIVAGSYTVEVTNAAGCRATSEAKVITVDALPTATITSLANSFCQGGSVVLTSSAGSLYKWMNGTAQLGTAQTYTATAAGSYTVEVTNAAGCKATSEAKVITVDALPTATITSLANSFCQGGNLLLTASTGSSYKWMNATAQVGTAQTYTATAAGSYTVEVTNAAGCKAMSAVKVIAVDALPTATITSLGNSFCQGGSVVLTSSAGSSYKWMNGTTQVGTAQTYTATAAGSYTVEVTNAAGCKAMSAAKVITVDALPTATITSSSTSFCQGGSLELTANVGSSYKWMNGTTQVGTAQTYTATTAGSYTVEVTNASGCKATSTAKVITQTSSIIWYADTDSDGKGDPSVTQSACTKPLGYVSVAGDGCPADANKTAPGNCGCGKTEQSCVDCAGVANGTASRDVCNICSGGTTGITPKLYLNECISTGINDPSGIEYVSIYPNPFESNITIDTKGASIRFYIYDASGALVETITVDSEAQIGEQLKSGLYLVRYKMNEDWYQFKMIKK
ncbi:cellulase family glycosylhydrolase [Cytophaga aurantiaca]|uniref:cellulase family glycosylhydrolase n=1 Tax=Cytophaga aurantiaca TaxID=29530 RepID=UPI0012FACC6A|nr:cellulase family glycosylhydrolase [Cytophaga aurantiaca]